MRLSMEIEHKQRLGSYITTKYGDEQVRAYIPPPLPPVPPVRLERLQILLEQANQSLGRLDGINQVLPDPRLFLYFYVRKEAVLSSQIEGTQSTISDLLLFEIDEVPGVPILDVQEVSSYVRALTYGLQRLKDLPLSLRLIKEIHGILLSTGRGAEKMPGEFRTSQNWIQGPRPGNALYVPPPPEQLPLHLGNLETFFHADHGLPILIRAGIAHVQFESIHPFLDGNGRLGRLLITFCSAHMVCFRNHCCTLASFSKSTSRNTTTTSWKYVKRETGRLGWSFSYKASKLPPTRLCLQPRIFLIFLSRINQQ